MPHNQMIATVQCEVLKLQCYRYLNCSGLVSEALSVVTGQIVAAMYQSADYVYTSLLLKPK